MKRKFKIGDKIVVKKSIPSNIPDGAYATVVGFTANNYRLKWSDLRYETSGGSDDTFIQILDPNELLKEIL